MTRKNNNLNLTMRLIQLGKTGWSFAKGRLQDEVLTNMQYNICAVVKQEVGISQDGVAQILFMDKSSTAKLVSKLVEDGYLIREKNPEDKRQYRLFLTEEGKKIIEPVFLNMEEWENKYIGEKDSESYRQLDALLRKIEKEMI